MPKPAITRVSNFDISNAPFVLKHIKVAADYQATTNDIIIGVDTTAVAVTITLPLITKMIEGQILYIKDEANNAATNNITIDRNGSSIDNENINLLLNTDSGALNFYATPTGWFSF